MKYRPDIDGIRALAVLLVILFHYQVPGVRGGYIGVDVFFVLSGYLISALVFGQLREKQFSFANFFFRRVRRLYPAYVVMMIATLAGAFFWLLPADFREFGQSLLASTVYVSNVHFWLEAGYFDTESLLKPLLHTWSLSAEEQFYLIFPFVAWATASLKRNHLLALFGTLTALSLAAAAVTIESDMSAVFYLYPFRAWEMFLGTLLALGLVSPVQRPSVSMFLSVTGLVMIVAPACLYDDGTVFPGLNAFIPCLGTALLLHGGGVIHSPVQRVLSSRIPVYLGKISYSLYLWHWPIYILYTYRYPDVGVLETMALAGSTLFAAALCHRYVETPVRAGAFRWSRRPAIVFGAAVAVSAIFISIGVLLERTEGLPGRLDARSRELAAAAGDFLGDLPNCRGPSNETLPGIQYCALGDPFEGDTYTLVWGDSHAVAFRSAYADFFEDLPNNNTLMVWSGGCPPVFGIEKHEPRGSGFDDEACRRRNSAVAELIESDERINAVVLIGRWSYFSHGGGVGVDSSHEVAVWPEGGERPSDQGAFFASALEATLTRLNEAELPVFVVQQPPEFPDYEARRLAIELMSGAADFSADTLASTVVPYSFVQQRQERVARLLEAGQRAGRLTLLRTHHFFCDEEQCSVMLDDRPAYFDNNHLSTSGSIRINSIFGPVRRLVEEAIESSSRPLEHGD